MASVALLVRLEAKPGKEAEVESFLRGGLSVVQQEPATTAWFAIRLLGIVARMPGRLSDVRKAMPQVVNTPELRFDCPDTRKFAVIEEVAGRLVAAAREQHAGRSCRPRRGAQRSRAGPAQRRARGPARSLGHRRARFLGRERRALEQNPITLAHTLRP